MATMTTSESCDECDRNDVSTSYCSACKCSYCDQCWAKQTPHKADRKNRPGPKHEKGNLTMIQRMHAILQPTEDVDQLKTLHLEDMDSRWFGWTEMDQSNKPYHSNGTKFTNYPRYERLMADDHHLSGISRYPKLVSFVGDTNAGKSTLVKALISQGEIQVSTHKSFPAPVPSSLQNELKATSEGVHIYADPAYLQGRMPILYADCEGLNGGEQLPFALEVLSKVQKYSSLGLAKTALARTTLDIVSKDTNRTKPFDPNLNTRAYAAQHLYPRFLYTFSDVIVFVQKNPKQLHLACRNLIEWANACIDKSLNQPVLPCLLVVLNAVETGLDSNRWTVEDATESFFEDVSGIVQSDFWLRNLADGWSENEPPKSAAQLLHCYYRSVKVIRIPTKSADSYALINDQATKLRQNVLDLCSSSHNEKMMKHRLFNVDELQEYLHAGFDHFAMHPNLPFDFKKVSLQKRSIAQDFGDHIVALAATVQACTQLQGKSLFAGLVSLIASCIMLDYARKNLPGSILDYFETSYQPLCKAALTKFCDEFLPCEFTSKKCVQCLNVKSAHVKGHQDYRGRPVTGKYKSSFSVEKYADQWIANLLKKLESLDTEFFNERIRRNTADNSASSHSTDLKIAVQIHDLTLTEFFSQSKGGDKCFSNSSCFGCLMAVPQHALGCGHILCISCVEEHAQARDDLVITLNGCPLHQDRDSEWHVYQKPEFAGLRILCLDGGGIRGIVELEILKEIESHINVRREGAGLQIQRFFDLIVGTSTGGIIALALAARRMSTSECIEEFTQLCNKAFSKRELAGSMLQPLTTLKHGSKWRTSPLHEALKDSLGEERLFGGTTEKLPKYATKVAVVSTSGTGSRTLVLANYNREEASDPGYTLEHPDDPSLSLLTWEAAAATSAAPSFFKPFVRHGRTYLDGALNHNNPVLIAWRERRTLWPDVSTRHPDMLLSLGTGQHKSVMEVGLKSLEKSADPRRQRQKKVTRSNDSKRYRAWNGVKNYFSVLVSKLDNVLDTEWRWHEFFRDTVGEAWSTEESTRYVRINPDLGRPPPALDAKEKLSALQVDVRKLLKKPSLSADIEDVANRLFASAFYFRKTQVKDEKDFSKCSGKIYSKFDNDPDDIERLGLFFKHQLLGNFTPSFVVKRNVRSSNDFIIDIDESFINKMLAEKVFTPKEAHVVVTTREEPTYIMLRLRLESSRAKDIRRKDYPISGFPRKFFIENERQASTLQRRDEEVRKRREAARAAATPDSQVNVPLRQVPLPPLRQQPSAILRPAAPGPLNSPMRSSYSQSLTDSEYGGDDGSDDEKMQQILADSAGLGY